MHDAHGDVIVLLCTSNLMYDTWVEGWVGGRGYNRMIHDEI